MTTHLNPVLRSRGAADQFLFSRTEAIRPEAKIAPESFSGGDRLSSVFPDAASGKEFVDRSLNLLSSFFTFSAMVIKIDRFADDIPCGTMEEILLSTARSIDSCCKPHEGMWGRLDHDRFGCFLPDINVSACSRIAEKIRRTLSESIQETVSIGIAGYPTINYGRSQILENAQKALDHAAFLGPDSLVSFDSVSLNISGDNYYGGGDVLTAIEEFKRALMLDPSNVNVHNSLGVCYGMMGDLEKAYEEFETAAWLDSDEFMAVYNMGIVSMLKEDRQRALERFIEAHRLGKDVFEINFQTGKLYLEMNQPENARPFLEKAVMLKSDNGAAFRKLGDCAAALEDTVRAIWAYKSAVKLNPNDAPALSAMGFLFDRQGENPEISTTFCLQSVRVCPDNGLFRHRLGELYLKQNRHEEALQEFEAALRLGHDSKCRIEEIHGRRAAKAS
jgi:tetratricopeptide (TPR) repeat protein